MVLNQKIHFHLWDWMVVFGIKYKMILSHVMVWTFDIKLAIQNNLGCYIDITLAHHNILNYVDKIIISNIPYVYNTCTINSFVTWDGIYTDVPLVGIEL